MLRRTFETGFIIGLFGLVSNAIGHWLTVPQGVLAYLFITIATSFVLTKMDKEDK